MPRPIKSFEAQVLTSQHRPGQNFRFALPGGESYSSELIDATLAELVQTLEQTFPGNQFDVKKTSRRKYNVVPRLVHLA